MADIGTKPFELTHVHQFGHGITPKIKLMISLGEVVDSQMIQDIHHRCTLMSCSKDRSTEKVTWQNQLRCRTAGRRRLL